MAFVHGKNTVITLDGDDLSAYVNTSELGRTADSHDVTTYGKNSHVYVGGLLDGKATMGGVYDNTAAVSPRAVIEPLIGSTVPLVREPEGTGAGKPRDTVSVVVVGYVETAPVADMVTWSCEMQCSDDIASSVQV
ncbi:hypothetical protein [Kribbella deserti]|uniref:Phage tail protein n=1 Tax=Kribbella deserti TaxID=1926257 RepID=A0ABV6QV81_9ACTN